MPGKVVKGGFICFGMYLAGWSLQAGVDPDLFDGRIPLIPATANRGAVATLAAPAPDSSAVGDLAQEKAALGGEQSSTDNTVVAGGVQGRSVQSSAPPIDSKLEQSGEFGRQSSKPTPSLRNFERFSTGGSDLALLPENTSKQLEPALGALQQRNQTSQPLDAATKGGQRSNDLQLLNRDRGTELPSNL